MIISVLNQKGGTGKTTVAVNLGLAYLYSGRNVCLIDADKQGTAAQFREFRSGRNDLMQLPLYQIQTNTIQQDVPKLGFDPVIIDVGGYDSKIFRGCMAVSDMVIVPCQPSGADIWSTERTFELLTEAREYKPGIKVYGLLNMVNSRTKAAKAVNCVVSEWMKEYNLQFFVTNLTTKIQYQYTFADGMGIMEQEADMEARREFDRLFKEVCDAEQA